jgi:UDP-N-acetyl-D-glucosamine dehydrogenase
MPFFPGPGLGGHCIPIDPFYLSWKAKQSGFESRFIELAGAINGSMPHYVVTLIADALNQQQKSINGSTVLVLGVAYKRDIDDVRESPALDVIRLLEEQGASVVFHDPFIKCVREEGRTREGVALTPEQLARADAVVVVTDHRAVDYQLVMDNASLIVDSRNVTKDLVKTKARVVSLSASRSGAATTT